MMTWWRWTLLLLVMAPFVAQGQVQYVPPRVVAGDGIPGGANTQVQFNDSDAFGGDAGLVFNKTTDQLTVGGNVTGRSMTLNGNADVTQAAVRRNVGQTANIQEWQTEASAMLAAVSPNGAVISTAVILTGVEFSTLGSDANGTIRYCSDCAKATPCTGSGTGAIAKRLNGAWDCD